MSYKFAINIGDSRIATNIYRFCLNHQINTPISLTCNCSDCCQTPANQQPQTHECSPWANSKGEERSTPPTKPIRKFPVVLSQAGRRLTFPAI